MKMDEKLTDDETGGMVRDAKHWQRGGYEDYHEDHEGHEEHKMMTMDDVSKCLQKDFSEEIADSKKYLCMAKIADSVGDHHDCHYLLEMAKDEYTHAAFIHDFMERHDLCISEEHEMCYIKLKEEMAKFF